MRSWKTFHSIYWTFVWPRTFAFHRPQFAGSDAVDGALTPSAEEHREHTLSSHTRGSVTGSRLPIDLCVERDWSNRSASPLTWSGASGWESGSASGRCCSQGFEVTARNTAACKKFTKTIMCKFCYRVSRSKKGKHHLTTFWLSAFISKICSKKA